MSSRYLIPLLCAGAIALACGPRAHNEASTPKKNQMLAAQTVSAAAPALVQQGASRTRAGAKHVVDVELYVRAADSNVRFALHVVNTGKKRIELTFPSGQTYDFAILDTLGREMWRWGNGRMFTQALHNKTLNGGEALDIEETLKASTLPPGRYRARGNLVSANYPVVQETEFTIPGTTIASR